MGHIVERQAKLNIVVTLICQIVTLLCGLIVPKVIIQTFGSEAYGATASITQFLSYITLLEGGIGGVARAALYKPLSQNDIRGISLVVFEIKRFFRIIAYIFVIYVFILACSYKYIADFQCLDWISTFALVWVISISTFVQYFVGISYSVLLQSAQKTYIINATTLVATLLNAVLVVFLAALNCNLIILKLVSSLVYALRPVALSLYVEKQFNLTECKERSPDVLQQKWTGLGQHFAYFLHSNTDIAILTVLTNLTTVSVYSVYNMVISQIQRFSTSFAAGMEALFGDMLAKKEYIQLNNWFGYYETLISSAVIILFSTTASLIVPFVRLYTANVADADYIQPVFSLFLVLSSVAYCLRLPYHSVTIAAGHFKQTRIAAYGEAGINIILSVLLVEKYGLSGVALATLVATLFRFGYYVVYLSKNILNRGTLLFWKRMLLNIIMFAIIYSINMLILQSVQINNYIQWALCGIVFVMIALIIVILLNTYFYRDSMIAFWDSITAKWTRKFKQ